MEAVIEKGKEVLMNWGPSVIAAIATLLIGWIVAKMLTGVLRRVMKRGKVDDTLTGFCTNLFYMMLMALVVVTAVGKAGVPVASFVAILGAAGLAVGFALQGSLANFAAGVLLIIFRPFRVGDYVEAGGTAGVVEEIQVFATRMKTPDNRSIIVPNGSIGNGNIVNYSAKDTRRIDFVFGIGYGDDIKKAKDILADILAKDERILEDPATVIAVGELADSSVNILARPWVKSADYWAVHWDVTEAVKLAFDAAGVSIPFPQQDVHMHQVA